MTDDLLGYLMEHHDWDSIWHPYHTIWFVGTWTGPDGDMLCLKRCDTQEEAERFMSPGSNTIESAIRMAMNKLQVLEEGKEGTEP